MTVLSTASYGAAVYGACAGRSTKRSTGLCATGRRNRRVDRKLCKRLLSSEAKAKDPLVDAAVSAPPNPFGNDRSPVVSGRNSRETCEPGASESRVRVLRRRGNDGRRDGKRR
jgi:hypothetical protein